MKQETLHQILIVDDEPQVRNLIATILRNEGYAVETADCAEQACHLLSANPYDIVFTDLRMPRGSGMDVLRFIQKRNLCTLGIVVTGYGTFESAIEALRLGAYDFLTKPLHLEEIKLLTRKALEVRKTRSTYNPLTNPNPLPASRHRALIGESSRMMSLGKMIATVANSSSTVLIRGESGTGKELVARALHALSPRKDRPLIPVNCGAIPEELLESELFGHVRGSFTGAMHDRVGRFLLADGGTIFLDEIGDMSPKLQVKLLRVIQEQEVEPVGSAETTKVDVRIIAATNVELEQAVEEKRFREDLYYRLNVIPIIVPPLRERREDIPLLVSYFVKGFNLRHPRRLERFTEEAMDALSQYHWPGNVRELENLVERMTILSQSPVVTLADLPERFQSGVGGICVGADTGRASRFLVSDDKGLNTAERVAMFRQSLSDAEAEEALGGGQDPLAGISFPANGDSSENLGDLIDRFERDMILKALEQSNGVKNRAAQLLGIKRTTLVEKMKKKNITFRRV